MVDFRGESNRLQIDRMVDGELSPLEQQSLLRSVDGENRWKELALAYVEAQTVQDSLRDWTRNDAPPAAAAAAARSGSHQTRRTPIWRLTATVAAGICAVAAVTFAAVNWWHRSNDKTKRDLTATETKDAGERAPAGFREREPSPHVVPTAADDQFAIPRLAIDLPVVTAAQGNPQQFYAAPPVITSELRAALRRAGHVVLEERRVYPVVLNDGRRVLIPVNEIKVKFVGNRLFQ